MNPTLTRSLPPPSGNGLPAVADAADEGDGLERLDPVCLTDVDPATARYSSQYNSRTIYFCAPSRKREFDRDAAAYLLKRRL